MKRILIGLMISLSLLGCKRPGTTHNSYGMEDYTSYVQDSRTGLCFLEVHHSYGRTFVNVPCSDRVVNAILIKGETK